MRRRPAAVGAATVVAALVVGGLLPASATIEDGVKPVFIAITPCRVMDTRPGLDNVGARATPIGANETHTISVIGPQGDCDLPADAQAVVMNVAAIFPTAGSFLTVFPADADRPTAANLNWIAGQPPVSNAVTADLSASGSVSFYNLAGQVDIAADIVGYYADHHHDDRYAAGAGGGAVSGQGGAAPSGFAGKEIAGSPSGTYYVPITTTPITFSGTLHCVVTATIQIDAAGEFVTAGEAALIQLAARDSTATGMQIDTLPPVAYVSSQTTTEQPALTRSARFVLSSAAARAGTRFGFVVTALATDWRTGTPTVRTSGTYDCTPA